MSPFVKCSRHGRRAAVRAASRAAGSPAEWPADAALIDAGSEERPFPAAGQQDVRPAAAREPQLGGSPAKPVPRNAAKGWHGDLPRHRGGDVQAAHQGDGAWYATLVKAGSSGGEADASRPHDRAGGQRQPYAQGRMKNRRAAGDGRANTDAAGRHGAETSCSGRRAESATRLPEAGMEDASSGGTPFAAAGRPAARDELRAWQRSPRLPSPPPAEAVPSPDPSGQRLNRAIAECGFCSRRKADELIFAGRVSVNGVVETHAGRRVLPEDSIAVDGAPLPGSQRKLYLMLHKPVQVVSTAADPDGRPTVLTLLPAEYADTRLFPVGRLDYFSEGLILLTNDGQLSQRLMHPRHHLPKCYEVIVRNIVSQKALQIMRSGMRLAEGDVLRPVEVTARSMASGCTLLRMVLRQGVNRQIRRMCRDLDLTILRLRRVAIGPLQLGDLPPGRCRPLREAELAALRQAVKGR